MQRPASSIAPWRVPRAQTESTVGSTGGCRPPLRNANVFDAELAEIEKRIAKLQRAAAAVRERMLPP